MRQQKTYLLKLWNDSSDDENWRASLEDVQTKNKDYFATLDKLVETLDDVTKAGLVKRLLELED